MLHRAINAHPEFRFPHLAWIFSLTRLRFDTPEASKYIFHAWRIMEIRIIEISRNPHLILVVSFSKLSSAVVSSAPGNFVLSS